MKRPRLDLTDAKARILCRLHVALANNENFIAALGVLSKDTKLSSSLVNLAIEDLQGNGFCKLITDSSWEENPFTGQMEQTESQYVEITRVGVSAIEAWDDQYYSDIVKKLSLTHEVGDEKEENKSESTNFAPASDRIVTLDHNKPEYKEAVSALDKVVAEFCADHRLDNELGAEKEALIKALEGGRALLNDVQVRVDSVWSLIIGPLKILATRYEKETVGGVISALATAAIAAVMKLIGVG